MQMDESEAKTAAVKINSALKLEFAFEDLCGAWEKYIEAWKKERSHLKEILGQIQSADTQLPISQDLYFATAFLLSRMTVSWDRDAAIKKIIQKSKKSRKNRGKAHRGIVVFFRNYTQHVGTLRGHISSDTLKREGYLQEEWAGIGVLVGELPEHDQDFSDRNMSIIEDYKEDNPGWEMCNVSRELNSEFTKILERYPRASSIATSTAEDVIDALPKDHSRQRDGANDLIMRALENNDTRNKMRKENRERLATYIDPLKLLPPAQA